MAEKSTIDYKNGCNDKYDSNDGNFDDNDDKKNTENQYAIDALA